MRFPVLSGAALIVLAACAAQNVNPDPVAEAALTGALSGRTAEASEACVNMRDLRDNRGFGEHAILFEGPTNSLVYLNRPPAGCPILTDTRALRVESTTGRLCRGDLVTVFDPVTGMNFGSCTLGDFVPYRK